MKRLPYNDGLKGIACFLVFVHHFLLVFYHVAVGISFVITTIVLLMSV